MFPRRGLAALAVTTVALVLLLSFKTPDQVSSTRSGNIEIVEPGAAVEVSPRPTTDPAATEAPGTAPTPTPAAPIGANASVDGPVVSTRWGPVQVRIVVGDGRLTDVVALQLPTGRHSGEISDRSEPILREMALQAQSANIDIVSGATYTSLAYAQSLQAALDQAGIG